MARPQSHINTVIIGAGQAGLCMSYCLSQQDVTHVVLERARIGERWRSERWDSLRFQFPSRYVRLPGYDYQGDQPEAFMPREGIVDVLDAYAAHIAAPVRCGINVRAVETDASGTFSVITDDVEWRADNVVLATGPYQRPLVPAISLHMPARIQQLTANRYTNARALPPGAVVVVGSGGSGVQIAEDLIAAGRTTYLCVGQHRRVPRRYRGRDIIDWMEEARMTYQPAADRPAGDHAPLLTGIGGGYDVDLRRLVADGGHLLGRLEGVDNNRLILGDTLLADIAAGDAAFAQTIDTLDSHFGADGTATSATSTDVGPLPPKPPTSLDIDAAEVRSVIWATGYGLDFSWVGCGRYHDDGTPVHQRGISPVPGLFYLGLPFMHNARSSFFWGVADDASYLAEHLIERGP